MVMLRAAWYISILMLAGLSCHGQLFIDGHHLVHDRWAGRYLCAVPDDWFGTDHSALVTVDTAYTYSHLSNFTLDGIPITANGTTVTFAAMDGITPHRITADVWGGETLDMEILFTCLPLLEVTAPLSTEYQHGTFVLHHPDSAQTLHLQGRIKWRGRTTLMEGRHKRNFHIKLEDEQGEKQNVKLLGMRDDNSWMLDGGQTDLSRIRNHVAQELWLDMAAKPYYADLEPKARSAVRGELIELIVNGQYEGIYTLSEAMDRKQMKLAKYETDSAGNHIIHGQLWKAVDYTNGTTFTGVTDYDNTQPNWYGFETKYPDLDEVFPTDYSILHEGVRFARFAYDYLWRRMAKDYYDLPVMRDYLIFLQVLLAIDNTSKNIYWAVYDREQDTKLTLAVWDLDCTVGQDWTNTPFRPQERVGPEIKWRITNNVLGRLNVLIADFHQDVIDHYHELRKGPLHADSLINRYHRHIDRLIYAGAAARESDRWSGDSDLGGHILDWEAEKQYIADWLRRRLHFLDNNTFALAAIETVTDNTLPTTGIIYDLLGRPMPEGQTLSPGIYVRDGQKFIVH